MSPENVITPTMNLDSLEKDMNDWRLLTLDQRKRSDEICVRKYGRTNAELYTLLKKNILLAQNKEEVLSESIATKNFSIIEKINESYKLQNEEGIVIINPWIENGFPDYSKDQLSETFNRYLELPDNLRKKSDEESIRLWGNNPYYMYENMADMLKKVNQISYMKSWTPPQKDVQISDYVDDIKFESTDIIRRYMRNLDIIANSQSIYESTIFKSVLEEDNSIVDYAEDIPLVTPWFTPDEMQDLFSIEVDPYDYIIGHNAIDLNESIKKAMFEYTSKLYSSSTQFQYNGVVEEAKNKVISLGWNPSVPFNDKAKSFARKRQLKWFRENKDINIIDLSRFYATEDITPEDIVDSKDSDLIDEVLEPVHVVLLSHGGINSKVIRGLTHANYSHAGLSFDEKMNNIYSFNAASASSPGKGGFSIESIDFYKNSKDVKIKILTLFVSRSVKNKLKKNVDYYIENIKKTKYSYEDIFSIALNKTRDTAYSLNMICSQFVDSILKLANIDITGKSSNLVVPGDFDKNKTSKLFCLFNDALEKFSPSNLKRKVTNLLKRHNRSDLITIPLAEVVNDIFAGDISKFYSITENKKANKVLNEIRILLDPESVIVEEKHIPFRFDKPGNLYIDLPRDLEIEYQEAHRLLESYNEGNIEGIKHQLARLFYINSIIERKIKRIKNKNDKDYKPLIDLRARVINDFKKYIKIVQNSEPNFDFEEYMKHSEYYNKTVVVDTHTMKYTGKAIRDILKLMV